MPTTVNKEIKSYQVTFYGGGKRVTQPYSYRAIIGLYDAQYQIIAALYFWDSPDAMPNGDKLVDGQQPMSHYPIQNLPFIMDILRNEKPIYYEHLGGWQYLGSVRSSMERVGDGDVA
jgi:hypothetical protein